MQKSTVINYYASWKLLLEPLCDLNFQKKSCFRMEGTEVSSFEEAVGNFKERYSDDVNSHQFQTFLKKEEQHSITQLYDLICEFRADDSCLLNALSEESLLEDPKWLSIVALSKRIQEHLNQKISEVKGA